MWNKIFRYIDDKWPIKARYKRFATKVCVTYSGIRSVEWTISLLWTVYSDKKYRAFFRDVTAAILEPQTMKPVSHKVLYWVRPCFVIINCKYAGNVSENTIDASESCGLLIQSAITFWGKEWDSPNQRTKRLHQLPSCILVYNHTPGECKQGQTSRQSIPDSEKRRRDISFSETGEYIKRKLKVVRKVSTSFHASLPHSPFCLVTKRSSTSAEWRDKNGCEGD